MHYNELDAKKCVHIRKYAPHSRRWPDDGFQGKKFGKYIGICVGFFSSTITTRKTRSDVIHKCDVLGEIKLGDGTYCIQILRVFYARFSLWYFQARGSIYFARIFFFFTAEKKMFSHSPYCIFWRTDFAYKWNGMGYVNEEKITLSQFQRWTSFRDTFWKR